MGDLIVMSRTVRPSPAIIATDATATILFFTGVRYYRMPETPVVTPHDLAGPARRRADKIKKPIVGKSLMVKKAGLARHAKRHMADQHA